MTQASAREVDPAARRPGRLQPLVLLTLVVGGLLSLALFLLAGRLADQQRDHAVERAGAARASALRVALEEDVEALVGLRSLWNASQRVTRAEFEAFTRPLLSRHPALRALEWAPAVAPAGVAPLVADVRGEGGRFARFEVRALEGAVASREADPADTRFPVVYVEPWTGNEAALGLDLGSETRCRAMLAAALAARDVCAGEPIELDQAPGTTGLLLALPVFAGASGRAEAEADDRLQGFVIGVLDLEHAVLAALDPLEPHDVGLRVVIRLRNREVFSLDLPARTSAALALSQPAPVQGADQQAVGAFELAGLDWRVSAVPGPALASGGSGLFAWLLLAAGLLLTSSLAVQLGQRENRARTLEHANLELAHSNRERELALVALRVSEERFRVLFEHHGSMMLVVDPAGGEIVDANPAAADFYGYSRETLRTLRLHDLGGPPADAVDRLLDRAGRSPRDYAVIGQQVAGGAERTIEIHFTSIDLQGRRLLFAILHDVSEREAMQRRLQESQKLESLGVLAGGIAHDFNNLLSSVIGNAELAERQLPAGSPARAHIAAGLLASQRAAAMTRRLLAYAGQGRQERRALDLDEQVREALELVRPNVPASVRVELELSGDLPQVEGDRLQLQQVALNLLLNAVEALAGRSGVVRVRTTPADRPDDGVLPLGHCAANHDEPHVLLEVADDGPGMDALTQEHIFEPFYSTKFSGRGLGLASVLGVVRAHEGQIAVDSAPGAGTRMRVWLPALPRRAAPQGVPAALPRVLVVDDEQAVREVTAGMLAAQGFEVVQAADGEQALERVAADPGLAAAVVDLSLPGRLGGAETVRALRSRAPGLGVVLMSGHSEAEALGRFGAGAPRVFLQKPFSAVVLAERVRAALSGAARSAAGGQVD